MSASRDKVIHVNEEADAEELNAGGSVDGEKRLSASTSRTTSSGESRRVAAERAGGKSVAAGGGVSKQVVGARKECRRGGLQ